MINSIYYGDCLDLMSNFNDDFIDMTLTSPPYADLRKYDGFKFNFEEIAKELFRITKNGGVVIWVVGDKTKNGSESGESFRQALYFKDIGFKLYDTMIYEKINPIPLTHRRYEQSFEYVFCFNKGILKTFNPIMVECKTAGKLDRYGPNRRQSRGENHSMRLYADTKLIVTKNKKIHSNIFKYSIGEKSWHPAIFPSQLAVDQITTWSNEGDLIFDPMMGSGTTVKIAKKLGRNYIGCDISKDYADKVAIEIKP